MRIKHGSITLILIQLFVISAMVGALSPAVSATQNDVNTTTSNPDFPEHQVIEDVDSDGLGQLDELDWFHRMDEHEPEFVPGEVLVKFRTSISAGLTNGIVTTGITSVDELNKQFEAKGAKRVFANIYKLTLPKDADVLSVAGEYESDPNVEYAEPNYIMHTFLVPNDENYTQQWAHQMIESEYAWNTTTGDPNIVIAIVDTGVDYTHPDLAANIWINTDEIPDNSVDDDNNGFVDDVRGWDFVEAKSYSAYPGEDGTEPDNDPMDFYGHGTHCAGIVAAVTNNEIGVAGVTWSSKIMAVRTGYAIPHPVAEAVGVLELDQAAAGIRYAADNGADIISMSFGTTYKSKVIYDAVKHAYDHDVLLVASAGNSRNIIKRYPAAYEEVVAVTATDENDNYAGFTTYGNWVEVAAPGVDILSTICPNSPVFEYPYDYMSGTSMAAPHVAGVAALIWSRFAEITRDQVRYQLRRTAVDKGDPGFDIYYGYGRINASGAANQDIPDHDLLVWSWKLPFASEPGDTVMVNTTVHNFGANNESNIVVQLLVDGTVEDSVQITSLPSGKSTTVSCSWSPEVEGVYNITTYVNPVQFETETRNNNQSALTWVRYGKAVRVPEDFPTIRGAIETTNLRIYYGDATIWVASGTYNEYDLIIQNTLTSLSLIGEDKSTAIISGSTGYVGLYVNSDNVTVTGFTIQNMGSLTEPGILGTGDNNIFGNNIVTNNLIDGIVALGNNNTVKDNIVSNHNRWGIWVESSSGGTITNNTLSSNGGGIYVYRSDNTVVSDNTLADTDVFGMLLSSSSDNVLTNNVITGNTDYSFFVDGSQFSHFIHDIGTSNTLNGKPIYYLINQSDLVVDPSTFPNRGYLGLVNSTNITVKDLTLSNNGQGMLFAYTKDSKIQNVTASNNYLGIFLAGSNNTFVSGNTITDNYNGVHIIGSNNTFVSGNTITDNSNGVYTSSSNNNTLRNNLLSDNLFYGIYLETSSSNTVSGNKISNIAGSGIYLGIGIYLDASNSITVSDNEMSNSDYGIYLDASSGNFIYHNNLINNTEQAYVTAGYTSIWDDGYPSGGNYWSDYTGQDLDGDGIGDTPYVIDANNQDNYPLMSPWTPPPVHNIDTGLDYATIQEAINAPETLNGHTIFVDSGTYYENVVINKPLMLLGEDPSTTIIDGGGGGMFGEDVVTLEFGNVFISGFTIQNGRYGIYPYLCIYGNTISGNTISNNFFGVYLDQYTEDNTVSNNIVSNNDIGILVEFSDGNTVSGNTLLNDGIMLGGSDGNTVSDNIVSNGDNIYLTNSDGNTVRGNTVTGSSYGIFLRYSIGNTVSGNTASNNNYGVYLDTSSNNFIYHNSFIDNTNQVVSYSSTNTWDDGYPSGGNYWSDYTGEDQDLDGIGDTPYVIDANNQDNYPLMNPWSAHDVAVTDVTVVLPYGAAAVYPSWMIDVLVTVRNKGTYSEIFDVTAYYDSPYYGSAIIETQSVSLSPHTETTLTFAWYTTGVSPGHAGLDYTISAEANVVSGETHTVDNTYVDGTVRVKYPGDVDGDGDVDNADLVMFQAAYGRSYPDPAYNPDCDFNGDGIIDVYDLGILSANYGHDPTQIRVPQDYPTIQTAINVASDGDSILVASGTYYENVVVNKELTIIGEDPSTTIIDGGGDPFGEDVVTIELEVATISGFTIQNGRYGIYPYLCLFGSTISGNVISDNFVGISIEQYSEDITVCENTISNNYMGIYISQSSDNFIYHNNFINNGVQVSNIGGGTNVWDDGYSSGGNYWSDYTGEDQDLDGIGDTPYVIDANNQDNYPLMNPWPVHDVAVTNVTATSTEVRGGDSASVIVTVRNQGTESETFYVTAYYDSNAIGNQTVTNLAARDSTTLNFTWDTTGVPPGNYTIKAVASTVPSETDTADNTLIDGVVEVWLPQYVLSIQADTGGTTSPSPGSYTYYEGTTVTVTATPYAGYAFDYWKLDGAIYSYSRTTTVTMYSDHTLKAWFHAISGCVAEGTLVTMADGSSKPVEEIKKGDQVLGFDPTTGSYVAENVLDVTKTNVEVMVVINNGMLKLTPTDQPIFIRNATYEGWVRDPATIEVGWEIYNATSGTWVPVTSITIEEGKTRVYDLTLDGYTTYIANSILLMDKC